MFESLMIPLDGSLRAESAVPVAASLSRFLGSTVMLLHIVEPSAGLKAQERHRLLVPPPDGSALPAFRLRRLLVALDSDREHEHGLPVAAELGKAYGAAVHVLAVPPAQTHLNEVEMEDYMHERMDRLESAGLSATSEIGRDDSATALVAVACRTKFDLIVLGTDGDAQSASMWSGGLAVSLCSRSHTPVLVIPREWVEGVGVRVRRERVG